jgi:glutathione S-transferase
MNEPCLAGNRFTVADICLYSYIDQLSSVGQAIPDDLERLNAWFERVGERPAADASLSEVLPMGMRC